MTVRPLNAPKLGMRVAVVEDAYARADKKPPGQHAMTGGAVLWLAHYVETNIFIATHKAVK